MKPKNTRPFSAAKSATSDVSRRRFLALSGVAGAQLTLMSTLATLPGRRAFASVETIGAKTAADEAWASVEEVGDAVWAVLSKPLAAEPDWRTLCNGGLIAGKERVLAVDAYARPDGASWVGETARKLTGRWPTDVVISHFHGDHSSGVGGFVRGEERPRLWITEATRKLIRETDAERGREADAARAAMLEHATVLDPQKPAKLDLGGRTVRLHPRAGHTPSDVTVEVDDPSVVFFGDLVWNEMFPNYTHATPSKLSASVRAAVRKRPTVYVPGHGPLADAAAVGEFQNLIDDVEAAARRAFEKGVPAAEAAKAYQLPEPLKSWHRFRDTYFELAMTAWHRELGAGSADGSAP